MDTHSVWPRTVRDIKWPEGGVTYTYEHRGYIRPEKLEYWLTQLFGPGKAKYMVCPNQKMRAVGTAVTGLLNVALPLDPKNTRDHGFQQQERDFHYFLQQNMT